MNQQIEDIKDSNELYTVVLKCGSCDYKLNETESITGREIHHKHATLSDLNLNIELVIQNIAKF